VGRKEGSAGVITKKKRKRHGRGREKKLSRKKPKTPPLGGKEGGFEHGTTREGVLQRELRNWKKRGAELIGRGVKKKG